jgi:hypothetical protein
VLFLTPALLDSPDPISAAWNGAASGCATGLALGWAAGPQSALQSCAMLGAFSYFLDGMAGGEAANASTLSAAGDGAGGRGGGRRQRSLIEQLLSPAIPVVMVLQPCRNWGGDAPAGACRVGPPPRRT